MALNVTLYEETGAPVNGRGSTLYLADNVGWKTSPLDDSHEFVLSPISRPEGNIPFAYSYTKVNFLKIDGTFGLASRVRIKISGDVLSKAPEEGVAFTGGVRLFYKLSSVYEQPSNQFDGSLMYIAPGETRILYPALSTTGPNGASTYPQYFSDASPVYSQYLITQLFVESGTGFGNIGELNIECYVDEYEDSNV